MLSPFQVQAHCGTGVSVAVQATQGSLWAEIELARLSSHAIDAELSSLRYTPCVATSFTRMIYPT